MTCKQGLFRKIKSRNQCRSDISFAKKDGFSFTLLYLKKLASCLVQTAARFPSRRLGLISPQAYLYGATLGFLTVIFLDLHHDSPMTRTGL